MIPRPACVVAFALVAAAADAPAADASAVSDTAHYHLVATGTQAEADDWARVLEAAWPQYAAFFGKPPALGKGERLNVCFFDTLVDMQAAIRKGGGAAPPDARGYWDPVSKAAYAWRQPSIWFTRALILHECAHQFHRLGRGAPNVSPPAWYGEGIVEHLSHHTWDGEHLRLGVVPMLSLEDWPGKALDAVKRGAFPLDDVVDGKAPASRPECMHLVRWLLTVDGGRSRAKFDELAARMDRGAKVDAALFAHTFGPSKRTLDALAAWLPTVQQPWEPLFVDWDARGAAALRGTASVVSACRRRAPSKRVSARLHAVGTGAWRAGVLLAYTGPEDYAIGMIANGTGARIDVRKDGAWRSGADTGVPASADGTWLVEAVRDGGSVSFVANGKTIGSTETSSASLGLAVDACTVDFTDIAAE